jgi:hypothetical protein
MVKNGNFRNSIVAYCALTTRIDVTGFGFSGYLDGDKR